MNKNFLAIIDPIETGKYVRIVAADTATTDGQYGCIKPLTDEAAQCLQDNFVKSQDLTSHDINIAFDSYLEFSDAVLPQHVKICDDSKVILHDKATLSYTKIEHSKIDMKANAKISDSHIYNDVTLHLAQFAIIDDAEIFLSDVSMTDHTKLKSVIINGSFLKMMDDAIIDSNGIYDSELHVGEGFQLVNFSDDQSKFSFYGKLDSTVINTIAE